ncbi:hypothetical protein NONI108955_21085 [Nocardia ninae]|uniref:Uncharacterized protein n=1 Tax=Nocardia ninae NBRC 108245 TaxID=1210091 RepID=A0A511MA33_9NOCA|nr:hypothetical protein [Nocardia ninae]GEM37449.1 hypothetical protein NN4_19680 [Nocardia ninae NBRC 108245]
MTNPTHSERVRDFCAVIRYFVTEIERPLLASGTLPTTDTFDTVFARLERTGPTVESMDLRFTDDELAVCYEAAEYLGMTVENAIVVGAVSYARQLLHAVHYKQAA